MQQMEASSISGVKLCQQVAQAQGIHLRVWIASPCEAREAMRAVTKGLFDYLTKPCENLEELEAVSRSFGPPARLSGALFSGAPRASRTGRR